MSLQGILEEKVDALTPLTRKEMWLNPLPGNYGSPRVSLTPQSVLWSDTFMTAK